MPQVLHPTPPAGGREPVLQSPVEKGSRSYCAAPKFPRVKLFLYHGLFLLAHIRIFQPTRTKCCHFMGHRAGEVRIRKAQALDVQNSPMPAAPAASADVLLQTDRVSWFSCPDGRLPPRQSKFCEQKDHVCFKGARLGAGMTDTGATREFQGPCGSITA